MRATCTAPKKGHTDPKAAAECPLHGSRGKAVKTPRLLGSGSTTFASAKPGEKVVNGLVAREHADSGQFTLVHADSGQPVFHPTRLHGRRGGAGLWESKDAALEWADTSYDFVKRVANNLSPRPSLQRFCDRCQRPLVVMGDLHECTHCAGIAHDYT